MELKFESPDNTLQPPDGDTNSDFLLTLTLNVDITGTFQTFSSNLSQWSVANGSLTQLQNNLDALNFTSLNIGYNSNGQMAEFGRDANNAIAADNFNVSAVPEPGTASLCLLALGSLLIRRRR